MSDLNLPYKPITPNKPKNLPPEEVYKPKASTAAQMLASPPPRPKVKPLDERQMRDFIYEEKDKREVDLGGGLKAEVPARFTDSDVKRYKQENIGAIRAEQAKIAKRKELQNALGQITNSAEYATMTLAARHRAVQRFLDGTPEIKQLPAGERAKLSAQARAYVSRQWKAGQSPALDTGSISAATEPGLLERAKSAGGALLNAATFPLRKMDEMAARAVLESGGGGATAQERYRQKQAANVNGVADLSDGFWQNVNPAMMEELANNKALWAGAARFGLNMATPSNALPVGAALNMARNLPAVSRAAAGAFAVPAIAAGGQQAVSGVREGDQSKIVEGALNLLTGGVGARHALTRTPAPLPQQTANREVAPTATGAMERILTQKPTQKLSGIPDKPQKQSAETLKAAEAAQMQAANLAAQQARVDAPLPVQAQKPRIRVKSPAGVPAPGAENPLLAEWARRNAERDAAAQPVVQPTRSLQKTASWVIREKATGDVIIETSDEAKVKALNTDKYEAVPIDEHLGSLNKKSIQPEPVPAEAMPAKKSTLPGTFNDRAEASAYIDTLVSQIQSNPKMMSLVEGANIGLNELYQPVKKGAKWGVAITEKHAEATAANKNKKNIAPAPLPVETTAPVTDAQARMQALAQKTVESSRRTEADPATVPKAEIGIEELVKLAKDSPTPETEALLNHIEILHKEAMMRPRKGKENIRKIDEAIEKLRGIVLEASPDAKNTAPYDLNKPASDVRYWGKIMAQIMKDPRNPTLEEINSFQPVRDKFKNEPDSQKWMDMAKNIANTINGTITSEEGSGTKTSRKYDKKMSNRLQSGIRPTGNDAVSITPTQPAPVKAESVAPKPPFTPEELSGFQTELDALKKKLFTVKGEPKQRVNLDDKARYDELLAKGQEWQNYKKSQQEWKAGENRRVSVAKLQKQGIAEGDAATYNHFGTPVKGNVTIDREGRVMVDNVNVSEMDFGMIKKDQPDPVAERLANAETAVTDKLQDKLKKKGLQAGVDPSDFALLAQLGAIKLARKTIDFAQWSEAMLADARTIGADTAESLKPHLQKLYQDAIRLHDTEFVRAYGVRPLQAAEATPEAASETTPETTATETQDTPLLTETATPSPPITSAKPVATKPAEPGRFRQADVAATMREIGADMSDFPTDRESQDAVFQRVADNYAGYLADIEALPADAKGLAREERAAASIRYQEALNDLTPLLERQYLTRDEAAKRDALTAEMAKLGKLLYQSGSEAGRDLAFQKALIPDPSSTSGVLMRADALTEGKLSPVARRMLILLSDQARMAEAKIRQELEAKAGRVPTRQNRAAQGVPAGAGIKEKLQARLTTEEQQRLASASQALQAKLSRTSAALPGAQFIDALPELTEIGVLYAKAAGRSFREWASAIHADVAELDEAQTEMLWAQVRDEMRKEKPLPASIAQTDSFADRLAQKLGREGSVEFLNAIDDGNQTLLNKLLRGEEMTPAEKQTLQNAWAQNSITRKTKQESGAVKALSDIIRETAQERARQQRKNQPPRYATPESVRMRATEAVNRLGMPLQKRVPNPLLDAATLEYANGARKLSAFMRAMRESHGDTIPDATLTKLFSEAAQEYVSATQPLDAIKTQMAKVIRAEVQRAKPKWQRAMEAPGNALAATRSLFLGYDLSFLQRQGGTIGISNPDILVRNLFPMGKAVANKASYARTQASIQARPNAEWYEKGGLEFSDMDGALNRREEAYQTNVLQDWHEKLSESKNPLAKPAKAYLGGALALERGNTAFLNLSRADLFDRIANLSRRITGKELTEDDAKLIAGFVNASTGRSDINGFFAKNPGFAQVLNSPRFYVSRLQLLTGKGVRDLGPGSAATRAAIAAEYAKYAAMLLTIYGGMKAAGAEVETDPRSSSFGQAKFGNQTFDMTSSLQQYVRVATQLWTGERKSSGKIMKLDGKAYKGDTREDVIVNFMVNKASPAPGAVLRGYRGKDFDNEPTSIPKEFAKTLLPLGPQEAYQALKKEGMDNATATFFANFFGIGTNVRKPKPAAGKKTGALPGKTLSGQPVSPLKEMRQQMKGL